MSLMADKLSYIEILIQCCSQIKLLITTLLSSMLSSVTSKIKFGHVPCTVQQSYRVN